MNFSAISPSIKIKVAYIHNPAIYRWFIFADTIVSSIFVAILPINSKASVVWFVSMAFEIGFDA